MDRDLGYWERQPIPVPFWRDILQLVGGWTVVILLLVGGMAGLHGLVWLLKAALRAICHWCGVEGF